MLHFIQRMFNPKWVLRLRPVMQFSFYKRFSVLFLFFLGLLHLDANAVLVTISSAAGSSCITCTASSSLYTGIGTSDYTTASYIYGADEIGTSGIITSFAYQKTSGTTVTLDSVYIFMKEVSGTTTPSSLSLTGYSLVYQGDFTNTSSSGWMTVSLTSPFNYTGVANLSVIVVRNRKTAPATMNYRSHYIYSSPYNGVYMSNSSAIWSSWLSPTSSTSSLYTSYYRPHLQLNINAFPACSGSPVAGTAIASTTTSCAGAPVKFHLTGSTLASSVTYSWDTSSSGSGPWALAGTSTTVPGVWTFIPPMGRTLYYRCRMTCTVSGVTSTSTTVSVSAGSPLTPPYSEDFESVTFGVNPSCAGYTGGWLAGQWWHVFDYSYDGVYLNNHTPGGSNYLMGGYYLECGSGNQEFWFTPGISLGSGKTYRFSYWYVNDGYDYYNPGTGAYIGTAQTRSAMSPIAPYINTTETTYNQYVADFSVASAGTYYLGVRVGSTYNYGFAIDDIGLIELPVCNTAAASDFVYVGKSVASPNTICSLPDNTTLSITETPAFSGLTFEWHRSMDPAFGTYTVVGTTKTVVNTISSGGEYYYRCKVTCPATGLFGYSNTSKVVTTPIPPPYFEDFETVTLGQNAPCAGATNWSPYGDYFNTKSGVSTWGYTDLVNHTPGGSKFLLGGYGLTVYTGMKDFWFTPAISLTAGETYEFSYWYLTDGTPSDPFELGTYVGTDQADWAMNPIAPDFIPTNTTYQEMSANFSPTTSGDYYFGIYVRGNYWYGLAIDDIGIKQLPPCSGKPSTAGIPSVSPTMLCSPGSATFSLSSLPKVANLSFQWFECDALGNLITAISAVSVSPTYTSGTISTTKYYRCVVHCTMGSATDTTHSPVVRLPVGAIIPPYIETFESGTPGTNMPCASSTYYFGYSSTWNIMGSAYTAWGGAPLDNHTPGGSKYLIAGYELGYYSGSSEYWFTPAIRFTAGKLYQFSYWYQTDGQPGCTYFLDAFMGTSQTPGAMTTTLGASIATTTKVYQQFKHQFIAPTSGDLYIGISKNQSNWGYGVAIDDIGVEEVPPCSSPVVAGTIVATPKHICASGGTSSLDLVGTTLATGLTYEWLFSNSASGPFTSTGGTSLPYNTDPLTNTTWFKAVVKCTASGVSDTTPAFKIGVGGMDLPYIEDFESTVTGDVPLCSDATYWSSYYYEGWYVCSDGTIGGPYKSTTVGGKNFLIGGGYLGSPSSISEDNYWFTPGLNLKTGYAYNLSFNYLAAYGSGYSSKMGVYIGKSQSVGAMTNTVANYRVITNGTFEHLDTVFTIPADGVYYLGFRKSGADPTVTYSWEGVAFDDINLNYAPCNGVPMAGSIIGSLPSGTQYCPGTQVTLTNIGATTYFVPGIKYQWQRKTVGGPIVWSNIVGATDTVISSDTLVGYDYRMAVICGNTNDTSYTMAFSVPQFPPHPPVSISPLTTPTTFCLGDTVKFNATTFAGALYEWTRDSIAIPGWAFSDFGAVDAGTYMVKVTSPISPCPTYSNQVLLIANDPGYSVSVTTPSDSIICAGTSLTLTATGSKAGLSYQWRKDNVPVLGATGTNLVVSASGYYRITATDGISGCAAVSRNIYITVKPNPPAIISVPGGTTTACENEGVRLNANTGGFKYEWTRGASTVFGWVDSSHLIKNSGVYRVKVRTADGCVSLSAPITVNILPSPSPTISRSGLVLNSMGAFISYTWLRNSTIVVGSTPSITVGANGVYTLRVTDINGCEGESNPIEINENGLSINNNVVVSDQIRIYPNPTEGKVFIESPVLLDVDVKDIAGKTIFTAIEAKQIDLSKYADGVYILVIRDKDQLIKQQRVTKTTH